MAQAATVCRCAAEDQSPAADHAQQPLYAYTHGDAWYLNRENDLRSVEEGKFGDLVVLDRDYFNVSDAEMRRTRPVLTVVDGEIAYDAGAK